MVTAQHMQRSKGKSFDEVINEDLIITRNFLRHTDMYEGIRAVIIDKDKSPVWSFPDLKSVPDSYVKEYFRG